MVAGLTVDTFMVRGSFVGRLLSSRDSRRLTPTSELESSHLVADVQMGESSPRSYSTDNGAEALWSLAIVLVYQVLVRRSVMQGLPLDPHYTIQGVMEILGLAHSA